MTRLYLLGKVVGWGSFGIRPDGEGPRGSVSFLLVFDTYEKAAEAAGGDTTNIVMLMTKEATNV